jgi:hypothetical protein
MTSAFLGFVSQLLLMPCLQKGGIFERIKKFLTISEGREFGYWVAGFSVQYLIRLKPGCWLNPIHLPESVPSSLTGCWKNSLPWNRRIENLLSSSSCHPGATLHS